MIVIDKIVEMLINLLQRYRAKRNYKKLKDRDPFIYY
jgi:hypothetical protein